MKKEFSRGRLNRLKKDVQDFRNSMEGRLVEYFKERTTEEVIKIMADWLSLDDLLELTHKVSVAEKILSNEEDDTSAI